MAIKKELQLDYDRLEKELSGLRNDYIALEKTYRLLSHEYAELTKPFEEDSKPKKVTDCSMPSCSNRIEAKGLCKKHYSKARRLYNTGSCKCRDCTNGIEARDMCTMHYKQAMAYKKNSGRWPPWAPEQKTTKVRLKSTKLSQETAGDEI